MFSPRQRQIEYRIHKRSGTTVHIPIELDAYGLSTAHPRPGGVENPEYMGEDCMACERFHGVCQAERALGRIAPQFDDLGSTDWVTAEVAMEGRKIAIESPAPRALASLMGLLMASSGCPRLIPFRVMALFHQPFATAEENAVRAAGFWLMRDLIKGNAPESRPFSSLQEAWEGLEEVNLHVSRKLMARTDSDVTSNGIAFLDVLAKMGTMGIDSVVDMLRPVLSVTPQTALPETDEH